MKEITTQLRNEIMEEYKRFLSSQNPDCQINGVKINMANVALDILNIYIEKTNGN